MSSFEELRKTRIEKLEKLKKLGVNPYPATTQRDASLAEVIADFEKLAKKKDLHLVGRVMSIRGQGGLVFFNINDGTGSFQGLLKKDEMDEKLFDLFAETVDIGDFVEISGKLFVTKRGEKTLASRQAGKCWQKACVRFQRNGMDLPMKMKNSASDIWILFSIRRSKTP